MAITQNPIIGRSSGSIQTLEFYSLNGRNIIRARKLKRYKPPSVLQRYNQELLKRVATLYSTIKPLGRHFPFAYSLPRNWQNYFIEKNLSYFSMPPNLSTIICNDIPKFVFFPSAVRLNYSYSTITWRNPHYSVNILTPYVWFNYWKIPVLAISDQARQWQLLEARYNFDSKYLEVRTDYVLFNSLNFHLFIFVDSYIDPSWETVNSWPNEAFSPKSLKFFDYVGSFEH